MVNVTSQRASRPAAKNRRAHSPLTSVLQPLRLRARDTFAVCVDMKTAFNPITPPRPIRLLTSAVLGGKVIWGAHLNPNPKPACFARAYLLSPRGTRSLSRVRACHGAFRVASPDATSTSVVPGKIQSPLWVLRGRITVGASPRLPCFLRERDPLPAQFGRGIPTNPTKQGTARQCRRCSLS